MLRRLAPVLVALVAVLTACQSAAPSLTSPTDIITKGLDATLALRSFHVSLALDGTITVPNSGASFSLNSTSMEADIDVAAKNVHLTLAVPAFLGLTADVLVIGKDLYVKTSMTGKKWSHQTTAKVAASGSPAASIDPQKMVDEVSAFLKKDGVVTKKLADVDCGDRKCYQVSVTVPSALMAGAGAVASLDPSTMFGDAVVLNLLFDREKLWLTEVGTSVSSDTVGTFSAKLSFSKFDEAVTFSPPPSAEVTQGEFTLPGM
ncbi:MAG: hypothetical protein ABI978_03110 [Chloroflexota bacterium]